ncbi:hypothetical protein P171DRAFT_483858 [Karstenula rhodostoma CBS 690.94]|uniref:Uncharacterized protein n=1 Tax=Karstenula rhodostoma CBS 690.94 TaxID=1392251 RepID=A0A9P4PP98_9PLEO|nr:hypothetical protein P171DRAFT_483858 [Karstenula rhodostoma CBS 690.94]
MLTLFVRVPVYGRFEAESVAKRPQPQLQSQFQPQPLPKPASSHHGRPALGAGARPHRPPTPDMAPQERPETRSGPSHGHKKRHVEPRKGQGKRQSSNPAQEDHMRSSPPRDNGSKEPAKERPRSPKRTPPQDQKRKANSPPGKHSAQKGRKPLHSRTKSPHRHQRKPKRSDSPHEKRPQHPPSHSYPHNDTRFPPPNSASPHPLCLSTKNGDHLTYHLLYENSDPSLSEQAKAFLSAAKAFRHDLPNDLDREALIRTALQERKGINRVSDGPRGCIWRVGGAEMRLVACLLGMKGVAVSAKGRKERFDLFGEGLEEAGGDVLLISRKVDG